MIHRATADDSSVLTRIAFESKRYWKYPEEYYTIWQDELTVTEEYIQRNEVYIYQHHCRTIAFFSMVKLIDALECKKEVVPSGLWLDHMFVEPSFIGRGIGSEMLKFAQELAVKLDYGSFFIFADPHSTGFYLKMGCEFIKDFPSSIDGRTTPLMVCTVPAPPIL
ncbi:MAG TPA: GNAT family N-acetyltransferase [Desulfopila sp.]|nr:GNAT family N-acetyltransferase [Desulfopila sp.]